MTSQFKKKISIIIPVLNEEENVFRVYKAIIDELEPRDDLELEIIFTDNHSSDYTFDRIEELTLKDKRVKAIRFARNFGFNKSILEGYRYSSGDAAIQIDCDLEDPPRVFHDFIRLWQNGYDVVVGIRKKRQENRIMILLRKAFYVILNTVSHSFHQVDAGDFRLIDRKILDQLILINDVEPYIRGLVSELASNQGSVEYSRDRREFGKSKFPFRKLITLALNAIYSHSTFPLKIATYIGISISLITILLTGVYIVGKFFDPEIWPAGFATTTALILFGISLNALFLGVIGEYIARIYNQVRIRPNVIIQKTLNIQTKEDIIVPGDSDVV